MFNKNLKPMLLKEVDKPFDSDDYIYELKYDGIRVLIYVSDNVFKIITRNGNDVTNLYPELSSIKVIVKNHKVIFDGEIVAFSNGKPSFLELQKRSHLKSNYKILSQMREIPVCFVAFDILYLDKDITNLDLITRKGELSKFKDNDFFVKTKYYSEGIKLFKHAKKLGLEGIVAKQKNSKYIVGDRVDTWLKIKNFKKDYFYIYGYSKLKDKYALFLGEYKRGILNNVGKVSVTKDNSILKLVLKQKVVKQLKEVYYVKPQYKILVHYLEKTKNNTLRQPFIKKT